MGLRLGPNLSLQPNLFPREALFFFFFLGEGAGGVSYLVLSSSFSWLPRGEREGEGRGRVRVWYVIETSEGTLGSGYVRERFFTGWMGVVPFSSLFST